MINKSAVRSTSAAVSRPTEACCGLYWGTLFSQVEEEAGQPLLLSGRLWKGRDFCISCFLTLFLHCHKPYARLEYLG